MAIQEAVAGTVGVDEDIIEYGRIYVLSPENRGIADPDASAEKSLKKIKKRNGLRPPRETGELRTQDMYRNDFAVLTGVSSL